MSTPAEIARMSSTEKIGESMQRSLRHLPENVRGTVESMLKPQALALIAGTLVVWAGSHFFGVGEFVDLLLLTVGVLALGFAVFEGASELYEFSIDAIGARAESDLERAGQHFARAVTLLGISTIQALLLRGPGRAVRARGGPSLYRLPAVGAPPPQGNRLWLSRPASIPGALGETDAYGVISVARNQPLSEQRLTLLHELVHRYFSPRTGPLRQLRAQLNASAYGRSGFLRYLEEALAEGYAQLRVHGLARSLGAYRFPFQGGYVTVSELVIEGQAIGTIVIGGALLRVSVSLGPFPKP